MYIIKQQQQQNDKIWFSESICLQHSRSFSRDSLKKKVLATSW